MIRLDDRHHVISYIASLRLRYKNIHYYVRTTAHVVNHVEKLVNLYDTSGMLV